MFRTFPTSVAIERPLVSRIHGYDPFGSYNSSLTVVSRSDNLDINPDLVAVYAQNGAINATPCDVIILYYMQYG